MVRKKVTTLPFDIGAHFTLPVGIYKRKNCLFYVLEFDGFLSLFKFTGRFLLVLILN
jgi:hypothetical protein